MECQSVLECFCAIKMIHTLSMLASLVGDPDSSIPKTSLPFQPGWLTRSGSTLPWTLPFSKNPSKRHSPNNVSILTLLFSLSWNRIVSAKWNQNKSCFLLWSDSQWWCQFSDL